MKLNTIFLFEFLFFHRQLESTLKKASQSISLIAGVYGDEPDDDEDKKSPPKTKSKRTGVHVKVQKPASKQSKPLLKDIPGIFKEENENNDEDLVEDNAGDVDQNTSEDPPKKKRRWGKIPINFFRKL